MQERLQRKTTEEEYKRFTDAVHRYMAKFGLGDWMCYFERSELDGLARVHYSVDDRAATFQFGKEWPDMPYIDVDRTAFHEVCHLLLADLAELPKGFVDIDRIVMIEHAVIRRLEFFEFPKHKTNE